MRQAFSCHATQHSQIDADHEVIYGPLAYRPNALSPARLLGLVFGASLMQYSQNSLFFDLMHNYW